MITEQLITKHVKRSESSAQTRYNKFIKRKSTTNKPEVLDIDTLAQAYSMPMNNK